MTKSNFYSYVGYLQSELGSKRPAEPSQNCLHRTLQLFRKQEQHYQAADIERENRFFFKNLDIRVF